MTFLSYFHFSQHVTAGDSLLLQTCSRYWTYVVLIKNLPIRTIYPVAWVKAELLMSLDE